MYSNCTCQFMSCHFAVITLRWLWHVQDSAISASVSHVHKVQSFAVRNILAFMHIFCTLCYCFYFLTMTVIVGGKILMTVVS